VIKYGCTEDNLEKRWFLVQNVVRQAAVNSSFSSFIIPTYAEKPAIVFQ